MLGWLRGPLTRNRMVVCVLTNQLATPGLGSLMAGRRVAGSGQLLLAVIGFGLIMDWMFLIFYRATLREMGHAVSNRDLGWMWTWGCICFGAAWAWALITSVSLWKEQKKLDRQQEENLPPRITNSSGEM